MTFSPPRNASSLHRRRRIGCRSLQTAGASAACDANSHDGISAPFLTAPPQASRPATERRAYATPETVVPGDTAHISRTFYAYFTPPLEHSPGQQ